MSFAWVSANALLLTAVGAGVSATAAVYGAVSSADAARHNSNMAKDAAKVTAQNTDEANNRATSKAPDSAALMAANVLAGKSGQSGTMLTGPQGVDPSQLTLGKNSLLGG